MTEVHLTVEECAEDFDITEEEAEELLEELCEEAGFVQVGDGEYKILNRQQAVTYMMKNKAKLKAGSIKSRVNQFIGREGEG